MTTIYLDHQATTPIDPRVLDAMLPWMSRPANPHAAHAFGRAAANAVEVARRQVAELVGVREQEIYFTSGATEAANIAIRSLPIGARVLTNPIEHACVRETLQTMGARLEILSAEIDEEGLFDPEIIAELIEGCDTVIAMAVNNEIGTIQPMAEIAASCRFSGVALFTDVTQAVGRIPVDLKSWDARAAWLSSHKIYGPQGIGALVWRNDHKPQPLSTGGGQEHGIRPGTVATALAVGFGKACELAAREMEHDARHAAMLSTRLLDAVRRVHPDVIVNGSLAHRIPHNLNLAFEGVDADALLAKLPDLAISTGSACSAGSLRISHVLQAITSQCLAASSIRIGFGRSTTIGEVELAAHMINEAVSTLTVSACRKVG